MSVFLECTSLCLDDLLYVIFDCVIGHVFIKIFHFFPFSVYSLVHGWQYKLTGSVSVCMCWERYVPHIISMSETSIHWHPYTLHLHLNFWAEFMEWKLIINKADIDLTFAYIEQIKIEFYWNNNGILLFCTVWVDKT